MSQYHVPVMLQESLDGLNIRPERVYVDATLGGGGHTREMLARYPDIRVFGFDRDPDAIQQNEDLIQKYPDRFKAIHANFSEMRTHLALNFVRRIDGILFDFGVSSHQFDCPERGFGFQDDSPLDMRMDKGYGQSAADVVNTLSVDELKKIFWEFGEERESGRIARAIEQERIKEEIRTTSQLSSIIDRATASHMKAKARARIYQALRIYVNQELEHLKKGLKDAVDMLNESGRIVAMSYHSLEDRIVKQYFAFEEKSCLCPSSLPTCMCSKTSRIKIITRKPLRPSDEEIKENSRARSAKLRIAEKKGESNA